MRVRRPGTSWMTQAACHGDATDDWSPDSDKQQPTTWQLTLCTACPVMVECMAYALATGSPGIWAGTNTTQRNALARKRTRAKCPACLQPEPVDLSEMQVCLACGASWAAPGARRQAHTACA